MRISDIEFGDAMFRQFMDLFVVPEISRRQSETGAPFSYVLDRAIIVFHSDGRAPEVRLNEEVNAQVEVRLSEAVREPINVGDPVRADDIAGIERTSLVDSDDQNCGHALVILIGDTWHVSFDFIYNKASSRQHLRVADQFLKAAENASTLKHWPVLVDTLCSASELTAKAYLLGTPDQSVMRAKKHGAIGSMENQQGKLGNLDAEHITAFNKVWGLRNRACYLEGELSMSEEEASALLLRLREFYCAVEMRVGGL